jgi:hypothetical protein
MTLARSHGWWSRHIGPRPQTGRGKSSSPAGYILQRVRCPGRHRRMTCAGGHVVHACGHLRGPSLERPPSWWRGVSLGHPRSWAEGAPTTTEPAHGVPSCCLPVGHAGASCCCSGRVCLGGWRLLD